MVRRTVSSEEILIIANQFIDTEIKTGGERLLIEVIKRWESRIRINLLIPEIGKDVLNNFNLSINFMVIPKSFIDDYKLYRRLFFLVLPIYLLRAVKSIFIVYKSNISFYCVYTTGDFICNTLPALFIKKKNIQIKWVAAIHHINENPFKRKGNPFVISMFSYLLQQINLKIIRNNADAIFLLNSNVKDELIKLGFRESILYITGAGVDLEYINSIANVEIKFDACFMGRLSPTKGVFDLPSIWQKVVMERNATLAIIGGSTPNQENRLKKLILEKDLGKYIFLYGFLSENEKYLLMKSSKIFIFPSYEEGWAISILEAMACKLPVVAWDLLVYSEIFKDGILTAPVGDNAAFSDLILRLLSDESYRLDRSKKAYSVASKYSWDEVAKNMIKIIEAKM